MKKVSLLLFVLLSVVCNDCWAQVTRTREVEKDGFVWYELKDTSRDRYYGAESASGKTIVPIGHYMVIYHTTSGGWFNVTDWDSHREGAYTKDGRYSIPISRGYEEVHFRPEDDGSYPYFKVGRNGLYGACDLSGREIIAPKYESLFYYSGDGFNYEDSNGNYVALGIKLDSDGIYRGSNSVASTRTTTSSSSSSSNSTSYSSSSGLRYKGTYTKSGQALCVNTGEYLNDVGDFTFEAEFYDDYIVIGSFKCMYSYTTSDGRKAYKYDLLDGFGNSTDFWIVDANYNMSYISEMPSPGFGSLTFVSSVSKGETTMPKQNAGGGYTGGDYNSNTNSGGRSTTGSGTTKSTPTRHECPRCHGSRKIIRESNVGTYGKDTQKYCSICGRNYWASSGHSHITCPQWGGKGYY